MKKSIILIICLLCVAQIAYSDVRHKPEDSMKICGIMSKLSKENDKTMPSLIIATAKMLINTPYTGGTLDREMEEKNTINISEVDCTTFVEQAFAIAKTVNQGKKDFSTFCSNLEQIRYRDGICNGYDSRLHYFTQWVADGEKKGIMKELSGKLFSAKQNLCLNYMSSNPDKYAQLKDNTALTSAVARTEQPFRNILVNYMPKSLLNKQRKQLPIRNGDIIAIVTTINGLDVTHMGIAMWKDNKLHLLHASSKHKKVVFDPQTLYDYLSTRKSAPGIRVVRLK